MTVDGDAKGDVETAVRKERRELVDRAQILVVWRHAETVEGRVLPGAASLLDDEIVEGLMLGVISCDHRRTDHRMLQKVAMRILYSPIQLHYLPSWLHGRGYRPYPDEWQGEWQRIRIQHFDPRW